MILKDGVGGSAVAEFVELANGCVCCSQRDGLVQTLELLMARSQRFDAILVETSGLANPGPVASIFWTDAEEVASLQLDSIVTVVDAVHFELQMSLAASVGACAELEDQVGYADTLIVNKADAVPADVLERVETQLRGMGDADVVLRASFGVVPLERILRRRCYAVADGGGRVPRRFDAGFAPAGAGALVPPSPAGEASSRAHSHSAGVSAVEVRCPAPVSVEAVERWLGALLWEKELPCAATAAGGGGAAGLLVLRAKGLLYGSRSGEPPRWHLLQAVHELFEAAPLTGAALEGAEGRPLESRVVLIGRGLCEGDLQRSFAANAAGLS